MITPIRFLFPFRGRTNRFTFYNLLTVFLLFIFTLALVWPSGAQEITFGHQEPIPLFPSISFNYDTPFYYLLYLNESDWFSRYIRTPLILSSARYLSAGIFLSQNQYVSYYDMLFLPPSIHAPLSIPYEYAWFLPFTQVGLPSKDIKSDAEKFMDTYLDILHEANNLTYQGIILKYPEGSYLSDMGYTVSEAEFYDLVKEKMGMTSAEEEKINQNGFVVSRREPYWSFGSAYLDLFYKDLPVFISTDSILQAFHRSYDEILADIEEKVLMDKLELILFHAQSVLPYIASDDDGIMKDVCHDVQIFYTVARTLLGRHAGPLAYAEDDNVQEILDGIDRLSIEEIELFGKKRKIDFSQFKPRGHYTRSEAFEKYFRAMIWLGRIDFRLTNSNNLNLRQLLDAYVIWRSVEAGDVRYAWDDMDKVIELMVGEPDAMNFRTMSQLMTEAGVEGPEDLLDTQTQQEVLRIMNEKGYGEQRICSHIIGCNPFNPEAAEMPKSFTFMGQRFTVDSHVFSNVVYNRFVMGDDLNERMLPDPLDAMFVLGNNRALHHLETELERWPYQGHLYVLRYLLDKYNRSFWESNMYNGWLDALRTLSGPFEGEDFPKTIRTSAYRDKLLHTQLASWAELRHDTILYVKQSYTGFPVCEYPDGYVEPIPEFYRRLRELSNRAREIFMSIQISPYYQWKYSSHFETFAQTMDTLETIARKQLEGLPRTEEETLFIKNTIIRHIMSGGCVPDIDYSGWYPNLFFEDSENCVDPDFIVADVHTNPAEAQVLHVGVGKVNVMYFTAETCSGPTLYVGPVFSYYERVEGDMRRLNDSEWATLVNRNELSPPWWTHTFLLSGN